MYQLQAHDAIVDVAELDARELYHVDLHAIGAEIVEQGFDHQLRLVMQKKRRIEEIDPNDTQRLLLQTVLMIEHADMDDDLAVLIARVSLVLHAHPAVALVSALKVAGCHGVGEGKEGSGVSARRL